MNTRNIQTFLMVSATFFAMSAPVRSNSDSARSLSNLATRTEQSAPARIATNGVTRSVKADGEDQNS